MPKRCEYNRALVKSCFGKSDVWRYPTTSDGCTSDVEYLTFDWWRIECQTSDIRQTRFGCRIFDIRSDVHRMSNVRLSTDGRSNVKNPTFDRTRSDVEYSTFDFAANRIEKIRSNNETNRIEFATFDPTECTPLNSMLTRRELTENWKLDSFWKIFNIVLVSTRNLNLFI